METLFRNSRIKLTQGLLFWREVGTGIPPVILLHGAWNDSGEWVSVMKSLAVDLHCFAPDLFGFGESENPDIHYSIDWQVECLAEFFHALKLEKVYLVGHSLGGWIAASYALKYSDKVEGLVLLAPEGVNIEGQDKRLQRMQRTVKRSPLVFKILRLLRPLTKILGLDTKIEEDWQMRPLLLEYPTACQLIFERQKPEIFAEFLQDRLYLLEIPVLVLQGGKDSPEALAMSKAYAQFPPKGSLKIIAHAGNDLPESCTGLIAEEIRDFILELGVLS
ncbi:MAG: alpha/beta fold hydrolase [Heteroscytonema crispum UTEX LB 1556]